MPDNHNDLSPCLSCGHNKTHHIYNEGACRPGFACPSNCEAFVPTPEASARMTDDELLDGPWWGDPEWPAWCDGIWRGYVERMHEWNTYRRAVATLLRSATPSTDQETP